MSERTVTGDINVTREARRGRVPGKPERAAVATVPTLLIHEDPQHIRRAAELSLVGHGSLYVMGVYCLALLSQVEQEQKP